MAIAGSSKTDRLLAWNSVPALEAVHYGQDELFTYVSNRPLSIALAMHRGNTLQVRLSDVYLVESLNFGFAMSNQTPFEGVFTLPTRSALSISGGEVALVPAPATPRVAFAPTKNSLYQGSEELVEALQNATSRLLDQLPDKRIQLRLSGGKDSRLLLGLLKNRHLPRLVSVTQGDDSSEEVMVGAKLAEMAGVEHHAVRPRLVDPTSVESSFVGSIREAQGFILSEALGAPYSFADPYTIGEGYAAGQWPTFKGPYERSKPPTLEDLESEWRGHNAGILNQELNSASDAALRRWIASSPAESNSDLLYMYGRDVRASRYMQASNVMVDAFSLTFFPFMDSEVTAVADGLLPSNRQGQVTMFLALRHIWNDSLGVPLARGGRFKFERRGPSAELSGPDFEARTATPKPRSVPLEGADYVAHASDRKLIDSPLTTSSQYLLDSPNWSLFEELISPGLHSRIRELSTLPTEHEALMKLRTRKRRIHTRLYLWRLILADKWLSKDWMKGER